MSIGDGRGDEARHEFTHQQAGFEQMIHIGHGPGQSLAAHRIPFHDYAPMTWNAVRAAHLRTFAWTLPLLPKVLVSALLFDRGRPSKN